MCLAGAVGGGLADVEPSFFMGSLDGFGSSMSQLISISRESEGRGERPMSGIGVDSGEWGVK
jgi:hypothetical protein